MSGPCTPYAFPQAVALYDGLAAQAGNGVLLGHQDTTATGVHWHMHERRSDIKDAVGRWPAVYGWDLGGVESGRAQNIDGVDFSFIARSIVDADRRGGVNTVSFHQKNPVSGGDAFDNSPAVSQIIAGAKHHLHYLSILDAIADFLSGLRRDDGTMVPLVVRPYHEANRAWPWWGLHGCTEEEYVQLWHMTVDYLREVHEMRHLLWCFAPQDVIKRDAYMLGYPGDDYVDVLGLDYYEIWGKAHVARMGKALSMVNKIAEERGKLAALTETGLEKIPLQTWWTTHLLPALQTDHYSRRTVWALLWRNKDKTHFFAPYPGHPSVPDFRKMISNGSVVMGSADDVEETDGKGFHFPKETGYGIGLEPENNEELEETNGFSCTIT